MSQMVRKVISENYSAPTLLQVLADSKLALLKVYKAYTELLRPTAWTLLSIETDGKLSLLRACVRAYLSHTCDGYRLVNGRWRRDVARLRSPGHGGRV